MSSKRSVPNEAELLSRADRYAPWHTGMALRVSPEKQFKVIGIKPIESLGDIIPGALYGEKLGEKPKGYSPTFIYVYVGNRVDNNGSNTIHPPAYAIYMKEEQIGGLFGVTTGVTTGLTTETTGVIGGMGETINDILSEEITDAVMSEHADESGLRDVNAAERMDERINATREYASIADVDEYNYDMEFDPLDKKLGRIARDTEDEFGDVIPIVDHAI